MLEFRYRQSASELHRRRRIREAYRRIIDRRPALFVRTNDWISEDVLLFGEYDPHVTRLIQACAADGHGDFLIDIGANIGLVSCRVADSFSRVYAFEPNPMAFRILETNAASNLAPGKARLFDVGIGSETGEQTMWVPKRNWGGAFIRNGDNAYGDGILARKDMFEVLDKANYDEVRVAIRTGREALAPVFDDIVGSGLGSGVVKIDVEGAETAVIDEIAAQLPPTIRLVIVFENFDHELPVSRIAQFPGRRVGFQRLRRKLRQNPAKPWIVRQFRHVVGRLFDVYPDEYVLAPIAGDRCGYGEIVVTVD